jgi:hypothetical protein
MSVLVLKVVLTPLLITSATLMQRRWGPLLAGLVVGLPLTSGPVALFFYLEHGRSFAIVATKGTLAGVSSEVAFCLAYVQIARFGRSSVVCLAAGFAAFCLITGALLRLQIALLPLFACVLLLIGVALAVLPVERGATTAKPGRWEIPARVLVATFFVVALTQLASRLGAHLSGLVTPFPIFAAVLIAFTHVRAGSRSATHAIKGVLLGLIAFASFFAVLSETLASFSALAAFGLSTVAAVVVQVPLLLRQLG